MIVKISDDVSEDGGHAKLCGGIESQVQLPEQMFKYLAADFQTYYFLLGRAFALPSCYGFRKIFSFTESSDSLQRFELKYIDVASVHITTYRGWRDGS